MALSQPLTVRDFVPEADTFREDVLGGLTRPRKQVPCKLFYDEHGSRLFEEIAQLDEYYLTRTETTIMERWAWEMAARLGPNCLLIEYGSGNSWKVRLLLDHLEDPVGYVPIDISREPLLDSAARLAHDYPELEVLPVWADYTGRFELPRPRRPAAKNVVYFPGSTIGNFEPEPARRFLHDVAELCGRGGQLLIGVDINRDPRTLHPAYNDRRGVTAAFNLNLLARINRELGADFRLDRFRHYAFYNPAEHRVEMHLVSLFDQRVRTDGAWIDFDRGESIWTESSYKYSLADFERLAASAGFRVEKVWTDPAELFSVQLLTAV